ncbi:craniofacial development protein 2-like [Elysia marginata]|uniref:Craniofacial development protein 2-like n=1 Tax=Elysia marginata TaxID=1093978 RepID=A0AAV4HZ10_9GAST|nr:craniofacial development protein 2-like [Elysia marginata]
MTGGDESREEVSTQTAGLLKPKQPTRIGVWNVRTLYQTGKLAQTIKEMKNYALELLGIAEARWTKTGTQSGPCRGDSGITEDKEDRIDYTWNMESIIEDRKQIKKKILDTKSPRLKERFCSQYKEKDIEVKRAARKDKRNYIEALAQEAQNAAELGDMKSVYVFT